MHVCVSMMCLKDRYTHKCLHTCCSLYAKLCYVPTRCIRMCVAIFTCAGFRFSVSFAHALVFVFLYHLHMHWFSFFCIICTCAGFRFSVSFAHALVFVFLWNACILTYAHVYTSMNTEYMCIHEKCIHGFTGHCMCVILHTHAGSLMRMSILYTFINTILKYMHLVSVFVYIYIHIHTYLLYRREPIYTYNTR